MANLFFPQLTSGALAQYPIRKVRLARTVKNVLPDGSMILYSDPNGAQLLWQLAYTELSDVDVQALQAHFTACLGPFHAFTFIDPTDNMLVSSSDMTASAWQRESLLHVVSGATDPTGGTGAFTVSNTGQANQEITQSLRVPSGYQYCFSIFATSTNTSAITMIRQGSIGQEQTSVSIGPNWTRVVSTGALSDSGVGFTIGISLAPGQQVQLYGPQLEAQLVPSRYRPTAQVGGVYASAHWGTDQLAFTADAPNLSSTAFSIETAL
ncbi:MAG TPA: hypothetical protein VHU83_24775 [Bryobacteraceae bacterium]|jgi:hypothetical protein|nr:hypothetical protein [Bryobacteraceae bacterium]